MRNRVVLLVLLLCCACAIAHGEEAVLMDTFIASTDAETLDLGDLKVPDMQTLEAFLDCFPNLTHVDMFGTPVKAAQIDELTARYPDVTFGWTISIREHTVRTDATAFSTLHTRDSQTHTSEDFAVLKYCPNLMALDLGHNWVTDLSFLYDLPKLRVLIIACNQVTDITPIGSLTDLEYLEMFTNKVTDIAPLANLTNLIDLNIGYNKILDFTPLYGLDKLERLWMWNGANSQMSKQQVKDIVNTLREELPNTIVNNSSAPTDGGWREHPRFEVIHAMFRTDQYMPFADTEKVEDAAAAPTSDGAAVSP